MKKIENKFVPYDLALRLKDLGFDEHCFAIYFTVGAWQIDCTEGALNLNSNQPSKYSILAPLWQDAFDWFRVNYNLEIQLEPDSINLPEKNLRQFTIASTDKSIVLEHGVDQKWTLRKGCLKSYEESRLECLKKLIEIVEQIKTQ
jgi:hypothetical protein